METITFTVQHFHELIRESYRQGYLNAQCDSGNSDSWNDGEKDFDDWLCEAMADAQIGDIDITQE